MKFTAIILAAGSGTRTGLDYNKIFVEINGKRVLDYSIDFFKKYDKCNEIVLVCSSSDYNYIYEQYNEMVDHIVVGGVTRQDSVMKGLNKAIYDYVLIHDSARPYLVTDVIDRLIDNLLVTKASTVAVFVKDTIVMNSGNRLGKTLDRSKLLSVQTPQAFETDLIRNAHIKAKEVGYQATDDTDLIARFTDVTPSYVLGDYRTIKLTTRDDIELLKVIL